MKGTVKWYNVKKGYGFIKGEDGEDYFIHFTSIPKGTKIFTDDEVTFEALDQAKGKQARDLVKVGEATEKASPKEAVEEVSEDDSEDYGDEHDSEDFGESSDEFDSEDFDDEEKN